MEHMQTFVAGLPLVVAGSLASLVAGLAAGIGALPILLVTVTSRRTQDMLLGCAAGIMLGATCFSLVLPAIGLAHDHVNGSLPAGLVVAAGICLGAVGLALLHRLIPHEHAFAGREGLATDLEIRRIWLFVLAITLHNFPEGLAVGVGFGAGNIENSMAITIAIFLQNLPEGFVVALAVLPLGYSRWAAILVALATGAVETVGGLVGTVVVSLSTLVLPWALAFAGGAMLFVISREMIPETHGNGHDTVATFAVIVGFALMMVLDTSLSVSS